METVYIETSIVSFLKARSDHQLQRMLDLAANRRLQVVVLTCNSRNSRWRPLRVSCPRCRLNRDNCSLEPGASMK
jgi:hypothetical protein